MGLRRLCEDGLWPGEGRRCGFEGGIIDFWVDRCNGSVFGNIEWGGRGRDVSFRKFGVFVENAIWLALVYLSRSTDIRQFRTSSRFHRSRFLSKSSFACWDSLIAKDYYGWDFNFHVASLRWQFSGLRMKSLRTLKRVQEIWMSLAMKGEHSRFVRNSLRSLCQHRASVTTPGGLELNFCVFEPRGARSRNVIR